MFKLKDIALFSGLSDTQLEELKTHILIKQYVKNSVVFYERDESEYLHLLFKGSVRLYKTSPGGKEIHLHNIAAPSVIALFPALETVPFPATCEFFTEGIVGLLSLEKLHQCFENKNFTVAIISTLSKRMKILEDILYKETIFSSEAKIADLIQTNAGIFQRLKNHEIASILNMTPETFSRILTKLKKENIIKIKEHVVTVLDSEALQDIVESNTMKKSVSIPFGI